MDPIVEYIALSETESFPVFRNLWELFAAKGNKTVLMSFGETQSPIVELHLSESLGCKVHIFCETPDLLQKWGEVAEILKTRKATEQTSSFAKGAMKKWVLPNNLIVSSSPISFSSLESTIKTICSNMNVDKRIDILKLETKTDKLAEILYAVLHLGYRPGMLLIHWETSPDSSLETTLLAGHLQNIGYGLVTKSDNKYLYYFTDKNLYEMCSWETNEVANPLAAEFLKLVGSKNTE